MPGKRTLVEQTYGHGLPAARQRPGPGEPNEGAPGARPEGSRVAEIAESRISAATLRRMLAASPDLADEIVTYLTLGGDLRLNDLMAAAFPSEAAPVTNNPAELSSASSEGTTFSAGVGDGEKAEKLPTDPTQPLPSQRSGNKAVAKGVMKWTLKADDHQTANVSVDFKPNASKVEATNVSYVQTVISKVGAGLAYGGGTATDPAKKKSSYQPFEEPGSKKRADHFPAGENDPFYGAEWDQGTMKWKQERASWKIGKSPKGGSSTSATLTDGPNAPESRMGLGTTSSEFETVPVVLETREPLAALTWGYKIRDQANSAIELLGGTDADCKDAPSADWAKTLDQFYAGKFAEILDGFDLNKADLNAGHKAQLDGVATKMRADAMLKAQLGGAGDLTEQHSDALSLKRAENARAYLIGKGIDAGRLELQSYGSDWARAEAQRTVAQGKNRRVQIWLHK